MLGNLIADTLSKAGWSWGCISAIDSNGRTIFVADAHSGDGQLFIDQGMRGKPLKLRLASTARPLREP